jgi:1-aminocyclopropane-1-carboxylate deaminase
LQGLIENNLPTKLLVFSALKGSWMAEEVMRISGIDKSKFYCTDQYALSGYAKSNPSYIIFVDHFIKSTNIAIDKIYNGKLIYGLTNMDANFFFGRGQKVLWINSGGVIP